MSLERLGNSLDQQRFQQVAVNRYVKTPEQLLALRLCAQLDDKQHKLMYLKLAKVMQTAVLEQALSFVADAKTETKGRLFMWKVGQICRQWEAEGKSPRRDLPPVTKVAKKTKTQIAGLFD